MKIGLSTPVIQRGKTGVAQYVFALLKALIPQLGPHELHLFVMEEDQPLFDFAKGSAHIHLVPERERPAVRNILWHQRVLPSLARNLTLNVLHVPSYRRMLWRKPCGMVSTIHDLAPFRVTGKYDWKRMFYGRVVVRRLARRQDHVIAVSENTARDLGQFFDLHPPRVSVVWNGIDHTRFLPGDRSVALTEARQKWGLDQPFFLYVSRLEHPAKNHVRLIEAFDRFKTETSSPWLLALAGSDWHGAEAIHTAARSAKHQADIRLLGFVDDASLPQLYRATEVFVYPSLFEGFGFPPVEAMACGCPVICTHRGALREVVGNSALIVDPESVTDIAAALTKMARSESERHSWRAAGFANARRFDWNENARQVLDIYQRVQTLHSR